MASVPFQDLRVYQLAATLADIVWRVVLGWDRFAKDAVGLQMARAADSVAANIAEGCGRATYADNRRFAIIARGSLTELHHWILRTSARELLSPEQTASMTRQVTELGRRLNRYIASIGRTKTQPPTTDDQ